MSKKTTIFRHFCRHQFTVFLLPVLWGLNQFAESATATRPEQLIDATRAFLEQEVADYLERSQIQARFQVQINRLDPRLRLNPCDQPLTTKLESPSQPVGRATVRVSCQGSAPWSIFVPAQIQLFRNVLVASRPLQRNITLTEADVMLTERDVGLLSQGYLTSPEQAVGNRLNRNLQPDQVLPPSYVTPADVVRKGDQVVISAKSSSINVRMPGEALSNGALGAQIRVRNQSSGRVVKARVTGPGQVEVAM